MVEPATGEAFTKAAAGNAEDIDAAIQAARNVFEGEWGALTTVECGRLSMKFSQLTLDNFDELVALEAATPDQDRNLGPRLGAHRRQRLGRSVFMSVVTGAIGFERDQMLVDEGRNPIAKIAISLEMVKPITPSES